MIWRGLARGDQQRSWPSSAGVSRSGRRPPTPKMAVKSSVIMLYKSVLSDADGKVFWVLQTQLANCLF